MKSKHPLSWLFILISACWLLLVNQAAQAAPELTIGNYQLVSSKRISRTVSEYAYKAAITNTGSDAHDVSATLNINAPGATILDGELNFGDVASGATVSSQDTFTIRQDRVYTVNESQFLWTVQATDAQPVIFDLSKVGAAQGILIVQTNALDEQICDTSCEHLSLELPVGTPVKLMAYPDSGAVSWSWGSLPCDYLSTSCDFVLQENTTVLMRFEQAELESNIFSVPARERHEYIDPNTGTHVVIPANATQSDTQVRLDVTTNQRGERLFSVEILDPESWVEGLHVIEINTPELLVNVEQQAANVIEQTTPVTSTFRSVTSASLMTASLTSAYPTSASIYPHQSFAPFVSYKLNLFSKIENRLAQNICPQITEVFKAAGVKSAEKKTECIDKEHAVATPRCTTEPNSAGACLSETWPVILVNGFKTGDGYLEPLTLESESLEYWNDLPYGLHKAGYAPYAFRWNTAQRFEDAASSLRELVDKIRERHAGKPPLIVAHSFGGLVARAYAQDLKGSSNAKAPSTSEVLGIVTIGTPHSGIFDGVKSADKLYPKGGDQSLITGFFLNRCWQISCYQAGRDIDFFQISNFDVRQYFFGLASEPGETIKKLAYPIYSNQRTRVPFYALIGLQQISVFGVPYFSHSDGLISWQGQRVHPGVSCDDANCENNAISNIDFVTEFPNVFGASVKEILLGSLNADDLTMLKPLAAAPLNTKYYSHSESVKNSVYSEETQTGIFRDKHIDGDLGSHDVLVAIKDILTKLTGKVPTPTPTAKLNDTGITTCSNANSNGLACPVAGFPGQDAQFGRDAQALAGTLQKVGGGAGGFDFTKLDNSGNPLPASATAWDCVKDNVTGLIWEVKTTSGLRSMNNTYIWYEPDNTKNGGFAGTQNGSTCTDSNCDNTLGYVQAVNSQGLCGASDWRMPNRNELLSIVDNSVSNPAIDSNYFPNTNASEVWSSSPAAIDSYNAWLVSFYHHGVYANAKPSYAHVRLVRGGQ